MYSQILYKSILGGILYGLGILLLTLGLNTKLMNSPRSVIKMSTALMLIYIGVWVLPGLGFILLIYLSSMNNISTGSNLILGIIVLALAYNIYIHCKLFRSVLTTLVRKTMISYAVFLLAISLIFFALEITPFMSITLAIVYVVVTFVVLLLFKIAGKRELLIYESSATKEINQPRPKARKIIWFGIDSVTWDVITPFISKGKLANLESILREGCHGRLKTFVPTYSPVIWTTMATGKSPLKHGIRDFVTLSLPGVPGPLRVIPRSVILNRLISKAERLGKLKRRPVGSLDRKCLSFWNILSSLGFTTGIVGWFVTEPVEKIAGFMVPDFYFVIDSKRELPFSGAHPPEINDEMLRIRRSVQNEFLSEAGDEEVRNRFNIKGPLKGLDEKKFSLLKVHYFLDLLRFQVARELNSQFSPDVLMVYFHGIDAVQHSFWDTLRKKNGIFGDVIFRYHEFIDEAVGILMNEIDGPKTVFITSDHGHGTIAWPKKLYHSLLGKRHLSGDHAHGPDGIFLAAGDGISRGVEIQDISVEDVLPTILPLLGLPVARDMDGRPVSQIYEDGDRAVEYIDSYEQLVVKDIDSTKIADDNQEIMQRLKDLGYID